MSFLDSLREFSAPEVVAGTAGGGSMIWLLFKRILVKSSEETKTLVTSDAQIEVINLLRDEVNRLSETNTKLATELNKLQLENINLKREIAQLHNTFNDMKKKFEGFGMGSVQPMIDYRDRG